MDKHLQTLFRQYDADPGDADCAHKLVAALRRIHDGKSSEPSDEGEDEDDSDEWWDKPDNIEIAPEQLEAALKNDDVDLGDYHQITGGPNATGYYARNSTYTIEFDEGKTLELEDLNNLAKALNIKPDSIQIEMDARNSECHCHPSWTHFLEVQIPRWAQPAKSES